MTGGHRPQDDKQMYRLETDWLRTGRMTLETADRVMRELQANGHLPTLVMDGGGADG